MSWRIAESLKQLRAQINAAYPNRDKSSDGGIGDAAHASRNSDHNPWVKDKHGMGVVTAIDIDEDLASDIHSIEKIVSAIRASRDPRVKYIIYERRITVAGTQLQQWKPYTGKNPHNHHAHISVNSDPKHYDSTALWSLGFETVQKPAPAIKSESEFKQTSDGKIFLPGSQLEKEVFTPPLMQENVSDEPQTPNTAQSDQPQTTELKVTDGHIEAKVSTPQTPPEKVAVEKRKKQGFLSTMRTEIGVLFFGNGGFQGAIDKCQQVGALGLSPGFWKTIGYLAIGGTLIYLLMRYLRWRKGEETGEKHTELLVTANSTDTNKVTLAATEDLATLKAKGYTIVERGAE